MENLGEKLKEIIETKNYILNWKKELKDLEKEKNTAFDLSSPFFSLDKFLKRHYQIKDFISKAEDKLKDLFTELK